MIYVDAHCHLGSRQYDHDRTEVIKRMLEAGVRDVIIICCGRHDLLEGAALRDRYPEFKLACGIHPRILRMTMANTGWKNSGKSLRPVIRI